MVALTLACSVAFAQEPAPSEPKAPAVHLQGPKDFAPPKLVVVPRPPEDGLPKGSLLASGTHSPRQVDQEELYKRQIYMHSGRHVTDSMPSMGYVAVALPPPTEPPRASEFDIAPVVFWSLISLSVVFTGWLLTKVCLSFARKPLAMQPSPVAVRASHHAPTSRPIRPLR